jgi:formate dehydrogenase beta subunit
MMFEKLEYDIENGDHHGHASLGEEFFPCDDVILAIGQENAFPWIERTSASSSTSGMCRRWTRSPSNRRCRQVFLRRRCGLRAQEHHLVGRARPSGGHFDPQILPRRSGEERMPRGVTLSSRKMGMHEWSYKNEYNGVERRLVPHVGLIERFKKINIEVELGFTAEQAALEVQRCLNCDMQTVFAAKLCIECDACIDICPVDCLTITHNGDRGRIARALTAPATNRTQALYVSAPLPQTARVMVKDEDVCVHCGLCAERCPTAAWDMQKSTILIPRAIDEEVAACPA